MERILPRVVNFIHERRSVKEPHALAAFAQFEIRVQVLQPGQAGIFIAQHEQAAARGNRRPGGERPLVRCGDVVAEEPAGEQHVARAVVVQLNPVGEFRDVREWRHAGLVIGIIRLRRQVRLKDAAARLAVAGLVTVGLRQRQQRRDRCLAIVLHRHVIKAELLARRRRVARIHHIEYRAKALSARAIERREESGAAGRRGAAQARAVAEEAARVRGHHLEHLRRREHATGVAHFVHLQHPRGARRRRHVGAAEFSKVNVRRRMRPDVVQQHIAAGHVVRVNRGAVRSCIERHRHMMPDVTGRIVRLIAQRIDIRRGAVVVEVPVPARCVHKNVVAGGHAIIVQRRGRGADGVPAAAHFAEARIGRAVIEIHLPHLAVGSRRVVRIRSVKVAAAERIEPRRLPAEFDEELDGKAGGVVERVVRRGEAGVGERGVEGESVVIHRAGEGIENAGAGEVRGILRRIRCDKGREGDAWIRHARRVGNGRARRARHHRRAGGVILKSPPAFHILMRRNGRRRQAAHDQRGSRRAAGWLQRQVRGEARRGLVFEIEDRLIKVRFRHCAGAPLRRQTDLRSEYRRRLRRRSAGEVHLQVSRVPRAARRLQRPRDLQRRPRGIALRVRGVRQPACGWRAAARVADAARGVGMRAARAVGVVEVLRELRRRQDAVIQLQCGIQLHVALRIYRKVHHLDGDGVVPRHQQRIGRAEIIDLRARRSRGPRGERCRVRIDEHLRSAQPRAGRLPAVDVANEAVIRVNVQPQIRRGCGIRNGDGEDLPRVERRRAEEERGLQIRRHACGIHAERSRRAGPRRRIKRHIEPRRPVAQTRLAGAVPAEKTFIGSCVQLGDFDIAAERSDGGKQSDAERGEGRIHGCEGREHRGYRRTAVPRARTIYTPRHGRAARRNVPSCAVSEGGFTSSPCGGVEPGEAVGVLVVGGFENFRGALAADDIGGGQHQRRLARGGETRGDLRFEGIDEQAAAHRAAGCHGCFEAGNVDHRIADWRTGIEHDAGEILEPLPIRTPAAAGLAVRETDNRHHRHAAALKFLPHLHRHQIAAAARNHQRAVHLTQREIPQNARGQSAHILEEHRLALAIRADHPVVKRQRQFHDGIPAWERPVARPHLLHHDATVSAAENMDHAPGENARGKQIRGARDGIGLSGHGIEQAAALEEIISGGGHWGEGVKSGPGRR